MFWVLAIFLFCQDAGELAAVTRANDPGIAAVRLEQAREQFTADVTNGHLRGFDDRRGQVVFRAVHKQDSSHVPGPLEDDVIAATLRGRIVADAVLRRSGVRVSSEAGKVIIRGASGDAEELAKLIVLALDLDGVTRVRADLPPSLRVKS